MGPGSSLGHDRRETESKGGALENISLTDWGTVLHATNVSDKDVLCGV